MSTITLPNIRVSSDLTVKLKLKDGGVAIDWSTLQNIKVGIHSDAQRAKAGNCGITIDAEDPTILVCTYAANKPQYLGVNRVIVTAKYRGETKTYDKPAFNFVRWTDDQAGEQITIDDPDVDVEISVEDISSSILQEAVDEAFTAADRANDAAAAAEHMVDIHTGPEGKSAYEVAVEEGYTGTEEEWLASLKGPVGETPDISIGTVTTVEPGTPAAASMSGTPEAPVLNLSIPKGLVGATPNFTVGTVTTGEPGSSVIVTITGTPEAPVLNLTIPQGMQGNTGSSVDYPYELVNNLTTNDATKGLSAAQGVVLDGKVSQLEAEVNGSVEPVEVDVEVNWQLLPTIDYTINSSNKWAKNIAYTSSLMPCSPGEKYKFVLRENQNAIIAFLKTSTHANNTDPDFCSLYPGRIVGANIPSQITIPSDGHYIYILRETSGGPVDMGVFAVELRNVDGLKGEVQKLDERVTALEYDNPDIANLLDFVPVALDANGWEIPVNSGMVNALKKAAQMEEIQYTTLETSPLTYSPYTRDPGTYKGLPYSSTKEIRKYIGWEVSQRTFMTALRNRWSLYYTENISSAREQSGYSFDYDGTNCGPYYGVVCSIFALFALGFKIPWDTEQFDYLEREGILYTIADQTAQGVHICDIIWQQGHTMLITGVQRDEYGNVINVVVSESRVNVKAKTYTAEQFDTYLTGNNCIIYRYTRIAENTDYTPSDFVGVRGESTPPSYQYNDDICFFAGDYAAWRYGDACWLNYTKGNYTGVKIYKDNTLVDTATLDADSSVHAIDISSYMNGYGSYKACLTDGVNDSDFTYWKLIEANITFEDAGAYQVVRFNSHNGTPVWVQVCSSQGVSYCWHEITPGEILDGYCGLVISRMIADQYDDATPADTKFVRVMFKTDYGCVVSPMVQI